MRMLDPTARTKETGKMQNRKNFDFSTFSFGPGSSLIIKIVPIVPMLPHAISEVRNA
jgi:hypothetical protein